MKNKLTALAAIASMFAFTLPLLNAEDAPNPSTPPPADGGQCPKGGCHGGWHKGPRDKDGGENKPAPSPSPAN